MGLNPGPDKTFSLELLSCELCVVCIDRLRTGWSVKTQQLQSYGRQDTSINDSEQAIIKEVIKRAEMLEVTEQERVG